MANPSPDRGVAYEDEHVHTVYQAIAPHFSSTRHKPWPIIERFLSSQPAGSVGLDAGCGNGKYLLVNPAIYILGSDRSSALVDIAAKHSHLPSDVLVADALALPHPLGRFDFALSIAVIHHLSTRDRRVDAVRELLRPLAATHLKGSKSNGKALIFVWALEQKTSRRGWGEEDDQDVMVPWVLQEGQKRVSKGKKQETNPEVRETTTSPPKTFQRYYHLYRKDELEEDIRTAGGKVLDSGYEKDNWWAVAEPAERLLNDI